MRLEDTLEVKQKPTTEYDSDGNPVTEVAESWTEFGKCFLSFNSRAERVRLNDGSEYVYSYYIITTLNSERYSIIPREGDKIHVVKADGTVDAVMEVKGCVTYKKRYLKIWV